MNNIKIVEYDPKYAGAVAEMWNKSGECWGGYNYEITADSVETDEENSFHLNLYLALDGDSVVGYCKLSELREDEGSLYIDLLNVIPEYHGKKIGKKLVLQCVQRATQLNWPRVDLYTWPGNIKAVPLYKKSGFFWEKRDGGTHLMNFMPQLLNAELLKDFFNEVDWYQDNKREIKIVPDGEEQNGLDLYEYHWANDDKFLKIKFCRRGRMISLIETDEFLIETKKNKLEHVMGTSSEIAFHIINKSKNPLEIGIEGKSDKNISFDFNKSISVTKEVDLKTLFTIGSVDVKQDNWKTYPNVKSIISINGKSINFGLPVDTLFPLEISIEKESMIYRVNKEIKFFMNLKNNMADSVDVSFTLPEYDGIEFSDPTIKMTLKSKEQVSIEIPALLHKSINYSIQLPVKIQSKNGEEITFNKKISVFLNTGIGRFVGENEDYHMHGLGEYSIIIDKKRRVNMVRIMHFRKAVNLIVHAPKLGKPFSVEFHKKPAECVEQIKEDGSIVSILTYASNEIKGIFLKFKYTLSVNGIGNCRIICENRSNLDLTKELEFSFNISMDLPEIYLPYKGKIIKYNGIINSDEDHWLGSEFTEKWIYTRKNDNSLALSWNDDINLGFADEQMVFSSKFGKLKGNEIVENKGFDFALHSFRDFVSFKKYHDQKSKPDVKYKNHLDLVVNDDNPFINNDLKISFHEYRQTNPVGRITLKSELSLFKSDEIVLKEDDKINDLNWNLTLNKRAPLDIIKLNCDLRPETSKIACIVFPMDKTDVKKSLQKDDKNTLHCVDNGIIEFKASQDFASVIYSLKYNGNEWLDSEYPNLVSRSWWNPWTGGISSHPSLMSYNNLMQEKFATDFAMLKDNMGNQWQGIMHSINISKNEKYKGINLVNYYLTLPGVPVLMHVCKINQASGKFIPDYLHSTDSFWGDKRKMKEIYGTIEDNGNRLYAGYNEIWLNCKKYLRYSMENRKDSVYIIKSDDVVESEFGADLHVCLNCNKQKTSIKDKETIFLNPIFYVFSELDLQEEWFKNLKEIRFKIEK